MLARVSRVFGTAYDTHVPELSIVRSQSADLSNLEAGLTGVVSELAGVVLTVRLVRHQNEMLGISVGMRCGELVVNRVTPLGLAEKAGVEEGDIITHVNGAECWRIEELKTVIASCACSTDLVLCRPEATILLSNEAEMLLDRSWEPVTWSVYSNNVIHFVPKSGCRSSDQITIGQLQRVELSEHTLDLIMAHRTVNVRLGCMSKAPFSVWVDFFRERDIIVTWD
mmetsp:Transcript_70899/g.117798  ORF Transcript_70899/g.117798 Transcript_70899/m.117798 type:complete len:225 (-) Transcript_70899:222-896(-)